MNFPDNLRYTEDHEWLFLDGNIATIGITDFAQSELGDIVFVDISTVGQKFLVNDIFGTVEAVKTVSDLFLPITGEILEINPTLDSQPEVVNSDPYGEGWMIKMRVSNVADVEKLLTVEAYKTLIGK